MSSLGAGMKLGGGDNCNRSSSRGADAADLRAKRLARFSNTAANRCCRLKILVYGLVVTTT